VRHEKPTAQHSHIKGDGFPVYERVINAAKRIVNGKGIKDSLTAESYVERIVSRALERLKPDFDTAPYFDKRMSKIARSVFDDDQHHYRWTKPATRTVPSSLPESSVWGTRDEVVIDPATEEPKTSRRSKTQVAITSPVKLSEPDEDGEEWSRPLDNVALDTDGHAVVDIRREHRNVVENRMIARLDLDNLVRRLVKIISLGDLRFVVAYLTSGVPRTGANRTRWSRLKKLLVTNREF
jgi:hypothetical protein